jgi:leucyl-tRNA synthetase
MMASFAKFTTSLKKNRCLVKNISALTAELQKLVLERANVKKWLAGKDPSKFLVVQNKLVNIVV